MPNTTMTTLPRTLIRTYLHAARLPLTAVESVLKTDEDWGPTLAFDAVEARVLRVAGSVLDDAALVEQGRLIEAKVAQLRKAAELETRAAATRAEAHEDLRARREADEAARNRVEEERSQRDQALARAKADKEREVERKAEAKEAAARKAEAAQEERLTKKERAARAVRVAAEQEALVEERAALDAKDEVLDLDAALRTTKAVRKAR